jgi:HEPN domain-containing protein
MTHRASDWLSQAEHDLGHARNSAASRDFDWACFAAHQAAEKAMKALFMALGGEAWGHSLLAMANDLGRRIDIGAEFLDRARRLDRHYIPTRYPNGFDSGAPHMYYAEADAGQAIADAESILMFCKNQVSEN